MAVLETGTIRTDDPGPARPKRGPRAGSVEVVLAVVVVAVIARFWLRDLFASPRAGGFATVVVSVLVQALPFVLAAALLSAGMRAWLGAARLNRWLTGHRLHSPDGPADTSMAYLAAPAISPVVLAATLISFPDSPMLVLARLVAGLVVAVLVAQLWRRFGRPDWVDPGPGGGLGTAPGGGQDRDPGPGGGLGTVPGGGQDRDPGPGGGLGTVPGGGPDRDPGPGGGLDTAPGDGRELGPARGGPDREPAPESADERVPAGAGWPAFWTYARGDVLAAGGALVVGAVVTALHLRGGPGRLDPTRRGPPGLLRGGARSLRGAGVGAGRGRAGGGRVPGAVFIDRPTGLPGSRFRGEPPAPRPTVHYVRSCLRCSVHAGRPVRVDPGRRTGRSAAVMRREAQGVVLLVLGAVLFKITMTGTYVRYVQPGMGPVLVLTALGLLALGAWPLRRSVIELRRRPVELEPLADGAGVAQDGGPAVERETPHTVEPAAPGRVWALLAGALALVLLVPAGAGAYQAGRSAAVVSGPAPSTPLPVGDPVPLTLREYTARAVDHDGSSLRGHTVTLTGFMMLADGRPYLARMTMGCCAADARPIEVGLLGNLPVGLGGRRLVRGGRCVRRPARPRPGEPGDHCVPQRVGCPHDRGSREPLRVVPPGRHQRAKT